MAASINPTQIKKSQIVFSKSTDLSSYLNEMRSKSPSNVSSNRQRRIIPPKTVSFSEEIDDSTQSSSSSSSSDESQPSPPPPQSPERPPYQTTIVTDQSEFILPKGGDSSPSSTSFPIHIVVNQNKKVHGMMEGLVSEYYNYHQQRLEAIDEKPATLKSVECSIFDPISGILFLGVTYHNLGKSNNKPSCNLLMIHYETKQILPIPDFIAQHPLYSSIFVNPSTVIKSLVYNTSKKHLYLASSVGVCAINFMNENIHPILMTTTNSVSGIPDIACLSFDPDNQQLYISGSFTMSMPHKESTQTQTQIQNICVYDLRTQLILPLPSNNTYEGPNGNVRSIYYWRSKQLLLVGGDFTAILKNDQSSIQVNHFFVYDVANKKILDKCFEEGFNDSVNAITMDEEKNIAYITGTFYETGKTLRRLKGLAYININTELFMKASKDVSQLSESDPELQSILKARNSFTPKLLGEEKEEEGSQGICELSNYGNCILFHKQSGFLYVGGYFNMLVNNQVVYPEITNIAIFDTSKSQWFNFVENSVVVGSNAIELSMQSMAPPNTRNARIKASKNAVKNFFGSYVNTIICDTNADNGKGCVYIGGSFQLGMLSYIVRLRWNNLVRVYNSDATTEIAQLPDQMTACKFFYLADQQKWSKIDFI